MSDFLNILGRALKTFAMFVQWYINNRNKNINYFRVYQNPSGIVWYKHVFSLHTSEMK